MGPIPSLIKKEFRQFRRDPLLSRVVLVMPVFATFLLGYAIITDVRHLRTAVLDQDNSAVSREMVDRFTGSGYFDLVGHAGDLRELERMIDSGRAVIGLAIPPGFAADLRSNRRPAVAIVVDGQDANSGTIALGYASRIMQDYSADIVRSRLRANPAAARRPLWIEMETRVWFNPNLKTTHFMVPGIVAVLLTMIVSILSGMAVVRERETGTLEQLLVTPIRPHELLLGKAIPFAVIGLGVITYAMTFGVLWFGVPVNGSLWLLFGFTVLYLLTILGEGLLVSTAAATQQQSMFFTWFLNVFALLMSGVLFPIENMPRAVQYLTYLNPIRYYVTVLREVLLKGSGIQYLWGEAVALVIFGLAVFGLAALRFNKRIA